MIGQSRRFLREIKAHPVSKKTHLFLGKPVRCQDPTLLPGVGQKTCPEVGVPKEVEKTASLRLLVCDVSVRSFLPKINCVGFI